MKKTKNYNLKPLFTKRIKELLKKDFENYLNILKKDLIKSLRCNTLKISPKELKKKLEDKGWKIKQPWKNYPEIMIIESELQPGELGKALEHLLGYYYIQELASMLPITSLQPKPNEIVLDLCSAPGSKTTQIASKMENSGTIIANEISLKRIKILASNLERCGVANTIIIKKGGLSLCEKLKKENFQFNKILVDAPCSAEGTLRSKPKTSQMWNIKTINKFSRLQKNLVSSALEILKPNGKLVYSTCTHAPEENEEVVDFILKKFKDKIKIEKISVPIISRPGITKWQKKEYLKDVKDCCRIYPQDNNTEGFFIAKFRKVR